MASSASSRQHRHAFAHLARVTQPALHLAPADYLDTVRTSLTDVGIPGTVARRDTAAIFEWLIGVSQFQGISDRSAAVFASKNGVVRWDDIRSALDRRPACPRLKSFWHFHGCGYRKAQATCAEPDLLPKCPLPSHPARKGSLIQSAYSLHLFMRDICDGDFVGWIDDRLAAADPGLDAKDRGVQMGAALIEPLRGMVGLGEKVWSMALADLLVAADPNRERWVTTGASLIVVDSLVHNFLHRTGTLRRFDAEHPYGSRCYGPAGCAEIVRGLAERIDARAFNPDFPAVFPRFVQHAIWRFSSQLELDICNGNRIDDRDRCRNQLCPAYDDCDRVPLSGTGLG